MLCYSNVVPFKQCYSNVVPFKQCYSNVVHYLNNAIQM